MQTSVFLRNAFHRVLGLLFLSFSLLLASRELSDEKSMSHKYEPAAEMLHISLKQLSQGVFTYWSRNHLVVRCWNCFCEKISIGGLEAPALGDLRLHGFNRGECS